MALAIALVVMVVASVLFHFLSPWWATPLASNWKQMDDTLTITIVITGAFFIGINLFVGYMVWRYRHRDGSRAAYQPVNHKLELWLIGGTTLGIMALLAPGLFVYADYVRPPRDAMLVEVVGQQWSWGFRFPGAGGQFGTTDPRFVGPGNPLGLNPDDPNGQDDIIVAGPELHLPLGRPIKILARSKDVLHDFYVPEFRARMNMVPGMVTSFWFTPTRAGTFDVLCAQLCGVGHHNMRGKVVVDEPAAFTAWLQKQQTFVAMRAGQPAAAATVPAQPIGTRGPGPPPPISPNRAGRWRRARAASPATASMARRASGRPGKACTGIRRPSPTAAAPRSTTTICVPKSVSRSSVWSRASRRSCRRCRSPRTRSTR
ncbi:cytochrome c oxidase subunit II [Cupriavidus gilardii CR3]|nr:cytochrome c oxidase subunit II [Cupriavidus gilardii CR3]